MTLRLCRLQVCDPRTQKGQWSREWALMSESQARVQAAGGVGGLGRVAASACPTAPAINGGDGVPRARCFQWLRECCSFSPHVVLAVGTHAAQA